MTFLLKPLIGLGLDVVILILLALIFRRGRHPRYFKLVLGAIGVAAGYAVYDLVPRELLGYLFVVVLIILTGLLLAVYGHVRLERAAVLSGLFCLLHFVIKWALAIV